MLSRTFRPKLLTTSIPKPGLHVYHSFGGFRRLSVIIGSYLNRLTGVTW
jgi:hypothetical protein